eukprot:CAMPEP_0194373118 /NCGR_PEP_ID=MMETSP0174-20130528/21544_1 /TAXON_ID=216777 /ORGANISM="Proboscia alata, Strain PI-D3" /LENGTH=59 /DNA_ID=CAMNT_0039152011 /DNA_START=52 /DNA_END=232 /DNA_ORIENTATION=+
MTTSQRRGLIRMGRGPAVMTDIDPVGGASNGQCDVNNDSTVGVANATERIFCIFRGGTD